MFRINEIEKGPEEGELSLYCKEERLAIAKSGGDKTVRMGVSRLGGCPINEIFFQP
ncbi:hypothetical protein PITCH_A190078 [uncultured Desulfobacterium sp.]|uniref:Uncharacterized protein n=1 Tax=uncultured Desulfobacterium sp. TaxID=201089 RepID=A0A445MVV5_9BACT|nr:hypothetical protein PITCH_A190078 [uncultured Desulfobacterium sp.]